MEWIGKRVKSRSKERLYVVKKRKKMEAAANVTPFPQKRRRQRRRQDPDSDIEDITPAYNDLLPAQVRDKPSTGSTIRSGSEQNIPVKESLFRVIRDLNVKKSGLSSSGLRDASEQKTCVEKSFLKVRDLDVPGSSGLKDVSEQNRDLDVPGSSGLKDVSEQNRDLDVPGSSGLKDVSEQNRDLDVPGSSGLKDVSEQNRDLDVPGSSGLKDVSEQSRDSDVPGSSGLKDVSEQNTFVKDMYSPKIGGLDAEKSVPTSSGLRDVCKLKTSLKDKCSFEIKGVNAESSVPGEIEILSDSESDIEARASAKKKLFKDGGRIVESSSDSEDDTSETEEEEVENQDSEENNAKDDITANSLSSEDPSSSSLSSSSSSSSDDKFNVKEVVGDTDDDDLRTATLPVRKVSIAERKPLGRYKRSGSCLTKPRKEDKKIRKLNCGEDEVERVAKQQGIVVFTCTHCGKGNTGIPESRSSCVRPQALGDEIEEVNNFASTNISKLDSVSSNSGRTLETSSRPEAENPETGKKVKTPEKPSTFGPEILSLKKDRELQEPEKPSTSRHEIVNMEKAEEAPAPKKPSRLGIQKLEKAKEVQANNRLGSMIPAVAVAEGLDRPVLANEPIDDDSDSSISSADKSGYESEPALKDKEIKTNNNAERRTINGNHKEVDLFMLLVNSVWEKGQLGEGEEEEDKLESSPEDRSEEQGKEDQRKYDDDGLLIIRPAPLELRFGVEEPQPPPEKSELEREEDSLWEELAYCSRPNDLGNVLLSTIEKRLSTDESPAAQCKIGNHELCLDLEIGLKCLHCGFVHTEIRHMDVAEWGQKITSGRRKFDRFEEEESSSFLGKFGFEIPNQNSSNEGCVCFEGSVWDKIPGVKSQMYPHQQEGFEFIWRNLAGTIKLDELKNFENSEETGGCIMSHAPGTGKTRLTIIFLQTYLECFPDCKPVIIAPASLLLTWAEEFKKWNISIPFHNLSSLEFTGKENSVALELLMRKNSSARSNNEIRMVKMYSWIKAKSILGISYNLYEKLAGVKGEDKKTKTVRKMKPYKELEAIREILMGMPGLLVLDEAHTPRNQRSCIWKTLSKVETQKRILLSGTPFQNNFQELCNVLGLARPKYLEKLSGMTVTKRGRRTLGDEINNGGIEELKTVMFPFVHVHKGSILQKSLPGLRECVVVLNPPELQKRVLESIEVTYNRKKKNVFETEHKLSLVSVHPSLVSRCKLSGKERLSIDEALLAQLKKVRLDPNQSVKTKFLIEFIRLCERIEEKVLVFSQYIDPLKLIMKHLVSCFKWTEGEEVLYMHGKLEQKQRQTLINEFNDPRSKAKVFLASTKACSEGINLVGASRVILLDVVWNPAVERQAISRAYRIGQQRIVYTYHLVAKGTPEGPKYCKQAQKDRISELVFACSSKQDKGKDKIGETVTEDKVLDTMVQHSTLGDMFDNLIVQPKEADLVEGFNILMP